VLRVTILIKRTNLFNVPAGYPVRTMKVVGNNSR